MKRNNFTWSKQWIHQAFLNNSLGAEVLEDDEVIDMGAFGTYADSIFFAELLRERRTTINNVVQSLQHRKTTGKYARVCKDMQEYAR